MKYRLRFAKDGVMRYVGHLDLMRFFQKALKRADVPLAYSQGFHPHPLISFAAPLSVGVTSGGEYMDIVTTEAIDPEAVCSLMNQNMVEGVRIVKVTELSDQAQNAMAAVWAADYFVYFKPGEKKAPDSAFSELTVSGYDEAIRTFYSDAGTIIVTKQTKKSERTIDIKPLIYDLKVADQKAFRLQTDISDDSPVFYMMLKSGSTDNIKPELVMEHFLSSMEISPEAYRLGIHRIDMYQKAKDGSLMSLGGG